jgi:Putative prokaryotic signal transducing protein
MALREPVAVYTAANNVEAHLIRNALMQSGLEAHVTEDVSQVGVWMLGLVSQIHKPQVWVEKADVERACPILEEFERRDGELRDLEVPEGTRAGRPIEVTCEHCGEISVYPAVQRGSVQQCLFCGAYVDVDNGEPAEVLFDSGDEDDVTEDPEHEDS